MAQIIMAERAAAPDTPASGKVAIYVRNGAYYTKSAAGIETALQGATGATGATGADGADGGMVLLATATASNVTSVDFTSGIDSTYDVYEVHLLNVKPSTDSTYLYLRTSSNGGSVYDAGTTDYGNASQYFTTSWSGSSGNAAQLPLSYSIGNAANENGFSGTVRLLNPSAAKYGEFLWTGGYTNISSALTFVVGYGTRRSAAIVNALRFFFSSGNINSGTFKLYGLRKSL